MSRMIWVGIIIILVLVAIGWWIRQQPTPSSSSSITTIEPTSMTDATQQLMLTSSAFAANQSIPSHYTCDGENMSPPLTIAGVPPVAESLVLIVDDPDAPNGTWDHWVVLDIPATTTTIEAGQAPAGTMGAGSSGEQKYQGPCPPSGEHHYHFKLYALDNRLNLPAGSTKTQVEQAMQGHILQQTELVGLYQRTT